MIRLTKQQYRQCRKLVRANGTYAYRWMGEDAAHVFQQITLRSQDDLAERADFLPTCSNRIAALKQGILTK